jgi:GNAT superfamily N-acetyltransferase
LSTLEFDVRRVDASVLYELRRRVLRGNDPKKTVADPRDEEDSSLHYGGFLDGRLVVSASFFPSAAPKRENLATYQLRYMATDFDVQGEGYGALVLASAEDALRAQGAQQVWANARDTALGFYRSTGWTVLEGTEHLSPETKLPHTVIVKLL